MPRMHDPWHPPFLGVFFNYRRCYFANEALNSYFFVLMVGIGINKNLACEILPPAAGRFCDILHNRRSAIRRLF